MANTRFDVLGIGNAIVDIIGRAQEDFLLRHGMQKGAMTLIDEDRAEALYAARVDPRVISGGSAANTVVGVGSFGVRAAYIGKVKRDPLGEAFVADIRSTGFQVKRMIAHSASSGAKPDRSSAASASPSSL